MRFFEFFALVDALHREILHYHKCDVKVELEKDFETLEWRTIFHIQSKNETAEEADAKQNQFDNEYYLERMDRYREINPLITLEFLDNDKEYKKRKGNDDVQD